MATSSAGSASDVLPRLGLAQQREVVDLAARVRRQCGIEALSDDAIAALTASAPACWHGVIRGPDGDLVGYVQLRPNPATVEVALDPRVDPALAHQAFDSVRSMAAEPTRLWVRGDHDPAAILVADGHAKLVRRILRLATDLDPELLRELEPPPLPSGFTVRPFAVGADDAAWLAANRLAFSDLPDQRDLGPSDLDSRIAAPWFHADGFILLLAPGDRIAGFDWTKIHSATPGQRDAPLGEIYALAVLPDYREMGLASQLVWRGLAYLCSQGIRRVILYVDATNTAAIRAYDRFSFRAESADVQYEISPPRAP